MARTLGYNPSSEPQQEAVPGKGGQEPGQLRVCVEAPAAVPLRGPGDGGETGARQGALAATDLGSQAAVGRENPGVARGCGGGISDGQDYTMGSVEGGIASPKFLLGS